MNYKMSDALDVSFDADDSSNGSPYLISTKHFTNTFDSSNIELAVDSPIDDDDCNYDDCNYGDSSPEPMDNGTELMTGLSGEMSDLCSSTSLLDQDSKRSCLVCGDVASGLHYGVCSCEACKAFFKRTIQGNIEYNCTSNGTCEITKRRRKACQACRFQKCLRMGMLKEGVRQDRVRGGRQKYKKPPDTRPPVQKQAKTEYEAKPRYENTKPQRIESKLLVVLHDIEPEKVFAMPDKNLTNNEHKLMLTLSDLTDRELVATIGWAKQLPEFSNFSLPDQMHLIQSAWLDVVCLNVAYRSLGYDDTIVFAEDFLLSSEDAISFGMPRELYGITQKLIKKLVYLHITVDEYLLLKAILLFNCDANVEFPKSVQQARDKYHDALMEYEVDRGSQAQRRVSDLLFLLPLLIQNKHTVQGYWIKVRQEGQIVLHKLLREMLEYNTV